MVVDKLKGVFCCFFFFVSSFVFCCFFFFFKKRKMAEVEVEMNDMGKKESGGERKQKEGGEISLSWEGLSLEVPEMKGDLIKRKTGKKRLLLQNIDGFVRRGECLAVMGPSGSGKSTLLDALTLRARSGTTGKISIYGEPATSALIKQHCAYVMQDDALHGVLTVRENLTYSALLRLPDTLSKKEKLERVEEVIQELGLSKCADTKIGNVFYRGVSGGERRRCSIGMELITKPSILLLDEPTSGLDAKSSRMIIETLQKLADHGNTVITTIHQPSSQIFKMFDKVMLLSEGELCYMGSTPGAVAFFDRCGYPIPPLMNPADHFLEEINTDFDEGGNTREDVDKIVQAFNESSEKKEIEQSLHSQPNAPMRDATKSSFSGKFKLGQGYKLYAIPAYKQFFILCDRCFWLYFRDPGIFWARVVMYSLMAIIMGTIYLRMDDDQSTIQDRISVLFFSVAFLSFMAVAAIPAFLIEKETFIRERRNGYYSCLAYALAHSIVSVPFIFLIGISFTAIFYYMVGLNPAVESFFYLLVGLSVALINAEGVVTATSAVVPNFILGIAMASGFFGMFMLLCGFFVRASNIPDYWIWFHYIDFYKYVFEGFMVNEFTGESFKCYVREQDSEFQECDCFFPDLNENCIIEGEEILIEYEYEDVDKWAWFAIVIGFAFFFHFMFYVFLRIFNTGER